MKKNLIMTLTVLATISEVSGMKEMAQFVSDIIFSLPSDSVGGTIFDEYQGKRNSIKDYENTLAQYEAPEKTAQLFERMNKLMEELENGNTSKIDEFIIPEIKLTPISYAIRVNESRWYNLLLENGANIQITDVTGATPLHHIASQNAVAMAEQFEKRVSDVSSFVKAMDINEATPLHYAAIKNSERMGKWLLKHGAEIGAQSRMIYTPLNEAVRNNSLEMVALLLDEDPNAKLILDSPLHSPLITAILGCSSFVNQISGCLGLDNIAPMRGDYLEVIKLLFDRTSSVDLPYPPSGWRLLHFVSNFGSLKMLELLVNRRPNLEARECLGNTPFRTALYAIRAQKELSFYDSTTAVQEELDSSYLTSADQICAFLAFLGVNTKPVCEEDKNEIEGSEFLSGFLSDINPLIKKKEGVHFKRFVEILIENQVSLEIKGKNGNTPLAIAAQNGFIESIDLLISAGADINSVNNAGETPLLIALRNNSEAAAILLISRGADVKVHDKFGQTALHYAMSHNLVSISASLINSNVDINAVNSDGDTPLFMAVKNKSVAALKVLTEREGIDVNSTDKHRVAPLFYAISQSKQGDTSNEIEEILIKKGAVFPKDLAAAERFAKSWSEFSISKNKLKGFYARAKEKQYPRPILPPKENFKKPGSADSKKTALTVSPKIEKENFSSAISQPNDSIETTSSPQTSSTAVDQKVELEKRKSDLLKTLEETDKALAELIKEKGKDAAFADMPLLSYAVSTNNFVLAELMLLIGADPTVKNAWGDTLLHMAAQKNSVQMVKLLLGAGLDINVLGNDEFNCTALYQAIYYGSLDVVEFLIEQGADVNIPDSHGTLPIVKAGERGYTNTVNLSLKHGAEVNSQDGNKQTALHRAAYHGKIDTMIFLLENGADLGKINIYGETPLFSASAALVNSANAVSILLKFGAQLQLNLQNTRGMTPLHKTFQFGNKDSTTLLLESGAKPDIKDRWGRMPHQAMIPPDIFNRASQGTEVGNSDLRFFPSFGKMPY